MKENTANRLPSLPPVGRPSGNRGASDGQKPKHTMKETQGGRGGPVRLPLVRPRNYKIQSRKENRSGGRFAPASRPILQGENALVLQRRRDPPGHSCTSVGSTTATTFYPLKP